MKIIDISLSLDNKTIIYPKNPEFIIEKYADLPENSSRLSKIIFGSHTGTHIDAPSHTILKGGNVETYSLDHFIGVCKVFDFSYLQAGSVVTISDFQKILGEKKWQIISDDKILIKTSNSIRGFEKFYDDFVALDGECASWLSEKNISLIGIDYLSIKKRGSDDNRAHNAFLEKNIPILEGINLKEVSTREYQISCLPLKFANLDGSPCRAILLDNN